MKLETKFNIGDIVYFPSRVFRDEPLKVSSFEVCKISIFKTGIYYSTTISGAGSVSEKECFSNEEDCKNYITHQHEDKGEQIMFENCNFDLDIDMKDIDIKNLTDFKKCFNNVDKLDPINNLEQIIEELWSKEPNIEKLSSKEVIEKCEEKGWKLSIYNIIKIREECKKDKTTYK